MTPQTFQTPEQIHAIKDPCILRNNKKERKPVYWCQDRNGYTPNIARAGIYSLKEAKEINAKNNDDGTADIVPVTNDIINRMYDEAINMMTYMQHQKETEEKRHAAKLKEIKNMDKEAADILKVTAALYYGLNDGGDSKT